MGMEYIWARTLRGTCTNFVRPMRHGLMGGHIYGPMPWNLWLVPAASSLSSISLLFLLTKPYYQYSGRLASPLTCEHELRRR